MKDLFIKLYYNYIPKVSISFNIKFKKRDERLFGWYLQRKERGFDNRELWNLSEKIVRKLLNLYPNEVKSVNYILNEFTKSYSNLHDISYYRIYNFFIDNGYKFPKMFPHIRERLIVFKEATPAFPPRYKEFNEWTDDIQKMIDLFDFLIKKEINDEAVWKEKVLLNEKNKTGMDLFLNNFFSLWY